MRIINKHLPGAKIAKAFTQAAPKAVLRFEQRRRSRQRIELDTGESVALTLKQGTVLRHGDILLADDGDFIVVHAAMETVLRVTAEDPWLLTRAAYHLGNRHVLVEIGRDYLQFEHDAVLVDMLRQLGGVTVTTAEAPFEPDAGAYGKGHKHGHEDTFAEDYALAQAAYSARDHAPHTAEKHQAVHRHGHGHDHGQAHGHGHGHAHTHDHDHD